MVVILACPTDVPRRRARLTRRSNRVLAGEDLPRSRAHLVYVGLETVKVLALLALGIAGLSV